MSVLEILLQHLLIFLKNQKNFADKYISLKSKVLKIELAEFNQPIILVFSEKNIDVLNYWHDLVDCTINTNLSTLLTLSDSKYLMQLIKEGDDEIIKQLISLIQIIEWDIAEILSLFLGDIAAEFITSILRLITSNLTNQLNFLRARIMIAITDEWHIAPSMQELASFYQEIHEVHLVAEQLLTYITKLENRI
ncbi:ubiquinone biosynthesis accessory factor UbiJ [Candidatus Palibaumannia cicadellinicola]|nr:SCP2 sterol-binding domain-containing protein [Candidatus Baumannia cicadellinicola]